MINIEYCPASYTIKAKGHAGYAPQGEDIVCAAASSLILTLGLCILGYTHGLECEPTFTVGEETVISCRPKKEREREIELLFWYCISGLDRLCERYPKHIGITVLWHEDVDEAMLQVKSEK